MCSYPHHHHPSSEPFHHPKLKLWTRQTVIPLPFLLQSAFQPAFSVPARERARQNPFHRSRLPCPPPLLENPSVGAFFIALFLFSQVCFDFFLFPYIILMRALVSFAWATLKTPLLPSVSLSALCPFQRCPCALSRTAWKLTTLWPVTCVPPSPSKP